MHFPVIAHTVSEHFFEPMLRLLPACRHKRVCAELPDEQWLPMALTRVLHDCRSGRAFLQQYGPHLPVCPPVGSYFESLKSGRRLRLLAEMNAALQTELGRRPAAQTLTDRVLENFDFYAGDGHWHGAAAHDPSHQDKKPATGHFYGLNLRTGGVLHLTGADIHHRRHEHDMRALKRMELDLLRQNAPKGRKVLWVWDKAGIDFRQWYHWKSTAGIYFISCAKENMTLEVMGKNRFVADDPVNAGVVEDELVGTSQGVMVRRVTYDDPLSGERFEFITTEMGLPPGWIAFLYRLRWNIEKVFDAFKNKLSETKSWASSATAKQVQAQLLCLAHNLLQLFQRDILVPAGVTNQAEDCRRAKRQAQAKQAVHDHARLWPKLLDLLCCSTQHSVKLIRWLRANLFSSAPCSHALLALRRLYAIP